MVLKLENWMTLCGQRLPLPLRVLPILLGWSPELVGKLNSVPRVMTRNGGLALDLSVNQETNPCATVGSKRIV